MGIARFSRPDRARSSTTRWLAVAAEFEEGNPSAGKGRAASGGDEFELFNLARDPSEKENLAGQQPEMVKRLRMQYEALARQAVAPKSGPKPAGFRVPPVWGE